ncbi:hypothetical protein C0Z10_11980 [Acidipropionibacterium jensenii]|uniref:Uncharacterized protein n=2 Tax=Acidipropionibacterium jensenii TaxID=1749 RepID=A0A3T0S285_9ACTN|nr:hypothetical protein C0Z10_11980 [Acidipropionibacterium jensenii]
MVDPHYLSSKIGVSRMQLRTIGRNMRHHWISTVAVVLVALVLVTAAHFSTSKPSYTSQTSIVFTSRAFESFRDPDSATAYTTSLIQSYTNYLQSANVLNPIAEKAGNGVEGSALQQSVQLKPGPLMLQISYENTDRGTADLVVRELVSAVRRAVSTTTPAANGTPMLQIVQAGVITDQVPGTGRSIPRSLVIGLVIGVIIGLVHLFLRALLDSRVRDVEDVLEVTDASVLGALGDPADSSEGIAVLAHNLGFVAPREGVHSVLLVSSVPGEGAGATALGAADALAASGTRTLLIDADLRGREVTRLAVNDTGSGTGNGTESGNRNGTGTGAGSGTGGARGLSDLLAERAGLSDVVTHREGVADLLAAGSRVGNPAELLAGGGLDSALARLGADYDVVVLAGAPLLTGSDSLVIAPRVAATVPVVGLGRVRKPDLLQAVELLDASGVVPGGVVLTGTGRAAGRDPYSALGTATAR